MATPDDAAKTCNNQSLTQERAKKIILIVDDDDTLRSALTIVVKKSGYQAIEAANGRAALEHVLSAKCQAVLTDIRMPEMDGMELLKAIKSKHSHIPVILMTGFAELLETLEANQLGASAVLAKPMKSTDLIKAIDTHLFPIESPELGNEEEHSDAEFCSIAIDEFISGHEIKFDIYVRIREGKYIKIAHQGEDISLDRVRAYKQKNFHYLFMRKDDFKKYVGFNLNLAKAIHISSNIPKSKKLSFLKHTGEIVVANLYVTEVDEEIFYSANSVLQSTVNLLTEQEDVFSLMDALNSHQSTLYVHSLGVTLYSLLIAKALGWKSQSNQFKLALAALFHDVGLKEIDPEIVKLERSKMTHEQVKEFETHSDRSLKILKTIGTFPAEVLQIAHQHHEECSGGGYPQKLRRTGIHPMAKLISVADEFCSLALVNDRRDKLTPKAALTEMVSVSPDRFDPEMMIALLKVFGLDPPEDYVQAHLRNKTSLR